MQEPLSNRLVVGVSAPALFDLAPEAEAPRARGGEEAKRPAGGRDGEILAPGRAFPVVQALARLGDRAGRRVELVLLSRTSADSSPRIFASLQEHAVQVARAAFTGGEPLAPYLAALHVDLLLSERDEDVRTALLAGTPAAMVTARLEQAKQPIDQVRIAFDGDAAVFGRAEGEADEVRPEGMEKPLARLLKVLAEYQTGDPDKRPVRTALLTRRASPAQERVIQSMREAQVRLDEAFFVGDLPREQVLEAFRAHLYFEDGGAHFRVPEEIVKMDLRATKEEAAASSQSPFSRLRLRSSD